LATQLNTPQDRVRFGEFEFDCGTRELKRVGQALRLEPQPAKVLSVLVRNAGEIVTRQELIREVWGSDTFVDFDQGLNYAIRRIRAALDDDVDAPRFLETVPKTGYRFIAQIARLTPVNKDSVEPAPPHPARTRPKLNRVTVAAFAALLALAAGFWYLGRPLPPPRITAYTRLTHDGRFKAPVATDGIRLYFDQFSPQAIGQVSVNGGEITPVPLTAPWKDPLVLMDISPDGSNALIGTGEQGQALSPIWVAPILGGSVQRVGDGENEAFSPDGLSVIYSTVDGDIILARIDGTEKHKLAHVPSMALPWNVPFTWSPDRKSIRFSTEGLLWEMSADGSGLHRLLPDWKEPGRQCCGRWTVDGHFYLFALDGPSIGSQIWLSMSVAGFSGRGPVSRLASQPAPCAGDSRFRAVMEPGSSPMEPPCAASCPAATRGRALSSPSSEESPPNSSRFPPMESPLHTSRFPKRRFGKPIGMDATAFSLRADLTRSTTRDGRPIRSRLFTAHLPPGTPESTWSPPTVESPGGSCPMTRRKWVTRTGLPMENGCCFAVGLTSRTTTMTFAFSTSTARKLKSFRVQRKCGRLAGLPADDT
jgi:DNA-binding winged helix-turn-helix (wHTH) protein